MDVCALYSPRLDAQRAWLDEEVEKVLHQKEAVAALEKVGCCRVYQS